MATEAIGQIKMLYVTQETYPPHRVDLTELFSRQLTKNGLCIDWMMQSKDDRPAGLNEGSGRERYILNRIFPQEASIFKIANLALDVWYGSKLMFIGGRYDVIQVRDKVLTALFGLVGAKVRGRSFVYWMSWPYPETYIERARSERDLGSLVRWYYYINGYVGRWFLYGWVLPNAHHVFVQSERMKQDVESMNIDARKMTAVPMGVCDEALEFEALALKAYPFDTGRPTIAYLGTLDRLRGIDFLIAVFDEVRAKYRNAQLVLIGNAVDGSEGELKAEIQSKGYDGDIVITGMVPRDVAWTYVKKADVCVSLFRPNPILASASPTKLVEYMALGRPVVVNEQPEQTLLVERSGGGIVAAYDVREVARGVTDILDDADMGLEMGSRGRAYIRENRVYSKLAKQVSKVYAQIVSVDKCSGEGECV